MEVLFSRHGYLGASGCCLVLLALVGRMFALTVQDRVIRLEMQLRLQSVLPPDLRARIPEFNVAQFVSMRFASDAELPELARKVLDEHLSEPEGDKEDHSATGSPIICAPEFLCD